MTPIRFKLGFGLATLLAGATVAHALPITLDLVSAAPKTLGPQSTSAPCIIAGTHCKNPADFLFTDFKQGGNIPAYDEDSPEYTIDQFPFLNFNVAIDVNTNSAAGETLQLFSVFVGWEYVFPNGWNQQVLCLQPSVREFSLLSHCLQALSKLQ
jgi:hypothetical protein